MAPSARSAKRRKLSSADDDASAANIEKSTPVPTPAKGTLKRPTRRAGLVSTEGSRASTRLAGRRGAANDLDDPDVYDDFDGAFGGSPARQLQTEAATAVKRSQTASQPKKTTRTKPKATKQSDSFKENLPEDDAGSADEETPAVKPARQARNKRAQGNNTAEKDRADELEPAPARSRGGRVNAMEKPETPARKTRTTRKSLEHEHGELVKELKTVGKSAAKTKTPAKSNASATKPPSEKTSLLDLLESEDKSDQETVAAPTPEPVVSSVSKKRSQTQKAQATPKKAEAPSKHEQPAEIALNLLKSLVLERITGKEPTPLIGLDEEYRKVHQLVEQTVSAGEGNSMLLIGARGSGKTTLVNQVLREISKDQRQDFHIIRLNGFVHTDDKLALREIWRQLGKEMDVEEDSIGKNYADTLSTLLALLSHPSELAGEESDEVAKAVVFIMDEFDLFASHPRQTLLYNLFDIAQSKKAPITVLGLTTRIDVSNNLEKRVKSRFSHRYVHLSLAKSLTSFQEICKAALMLQPEDLIDSEQSVLSTRSPPKSRSGAKGKQAAHSKDLRTAWNDSVESLFADDGFVHFHIEPHYYTNKSISSALSAFLLPISLLSPSTFPLTAAHFSTSTGQSLASSSALLAPPDSKLTLLPSLSDLALGLLISTARLDIIHDADTCNFNMAYAEYVSLASKAKIASAAGGALAAGATGTKVWGREASRGEWERLVRYHLLLPVVGGGGSGGGIGGGSADSAMVRCDVALEEIAPSVPGLDRVLEKWCRHI
ncbi:origin recognition complex subunit 4 [Neofusicoccum ribis]|uniref:Origin recognition complex subunit 4 n=1 Tax=Neofusicoccum ribis TaxID=45134 RepID=A0ABR3SP78_9PEZI